MDIGEHKSSLRGRGSRHSTQGRGVSWAPDTVDKDFDRSAGKPLFTDLNTSTGVCIPEASGGPIVVTTTNHLLWYCHGAGFEITTHLPVDSR